VSNKRFPKEVIAHWPEIFKDVEVHAIPLQYLNSITISFKDGKIWEIDLNDDRNMLEEDLEYSIDSLLTEYEDEIENIDFRLDTEKVRRDIEKRTSTFLKKRK
tara:strand:- start:530 stop:838 length:309 start_codon:yes stop_codon:yes gene_type:complete